MVQITAVQLRQIMPASGGHATIFVAPLNIAMARFGVNTVPRISAFLAQVGHESAHLLCTEERLGYSAEALIRTWPKRFDTETAPRLEYHPQEIANVAYAGRNGNGDEHSGDGWKYRGRGLLQITGRANYAECGTGIGVDLINKPDLLTLADHAAMSAAWFWSSRGLNALADNGDFKSITQKINGGLNGYQDRLAFLLRAESVLAKVK